MLKDNHPFVENVENSFCAQCKRPKGHPIHRLSREDPEMIRGTAKPTKLG